MQIVVVNTAKNSKRGGSCLDGLARMIRGRCAAAWLEYVSEKVFTVFEAGQYVVLYENGRGYVAFGTATGKFSRSRSKESKNRIDRERDGQEHVQGVSWECWIPEPTPGYTGIEHTSQTCCRKRISVKQWRDLKEHIRRVGTRVGSK